jgi:uncharacterized protein DUF2834
MKPKTVYLFLCIVVAVAAYRVFRSTARGKPPKRKSLGSSAFANRVSTFFALDVLALALVRLRFIGVQGTRLQPKRPSLVSRSVVLVGVYLGLPLSLYLRDRQLEQNAAASAQ